MKNSRNIRALHDAVASLPDVWMTNRRSRQDKSEPPRLVAASYARFSTDAQSETSVERQEVLCEEYAARMGIELKERYADRARSGNTLVDRRGLEDMLTAARQWKFGILLVENVDRLARNLSILSMVFKELEALGIEIHQPGRGKLGLTDIAFHGLMGDEGRRLFLERCRYGRLQAAREGRVPNSGCYGYARVLGQPGERVIVEEQAAAIREIYQMRLDGMSARQIAYFRNNSGAVDRTWTTNGISHLLRNPLYNGIMVYNQCASVKNANTGKRQIVRRPPEEWVIAPVGHLRIVEREVWEAVQALTSQNAANDGPGPKVWHKYLLSGKVKCPSCGGNMVIRCVTGSNHRNLACNNFFTTGICKSRRSIKLDDLERLVIQMVAQNVLDPRCTEAYVAAYNAERQKSREDHHATRERIQRDLDRVNRELKDTFKSAMTVGLTTETIFEMRQELNAEAAKYQCQLGAMSMTPKPVGLDQGRMRTLREAIGDMALNIPFLPEDEAGVRLAASFRELIERIVVRRTGYGSFEAEVTLTITPLLAGDGGRIDDGTERMSLRGSYTRKSRGYAASEAAKVNLSRLAEGHFSLRENEWQVVRDLIPTGFLTKRGGTHYTPLETRRILEAHLFILMTGASWPALPTCLGKSVTVYNAVSKLISLGIWRKIAITLANIDPVRYSSDFADATGKNVKIYQRRGVEPSVPAVLAEAA